MVFAMLARQMPIVRRTVLLLSMADGLPGLRALLLAGVAHRHAPAQTRRRPMAGRIVLEFQVRVVTHKLVLPGRGLALVSALSVREIIHAQELLSVRIVQEAAHLLDPAVLLVAVA